jgi:hypothetical protein
VAIGELAEEVEIEKGLPAYAVGARLKVPSVIVEAEATAMDCPKVPEPGDLGYKSHKLRIWPKTSNLQKPLQRFALGRLSVFGLRARQPSGRRAQRNE